MKKAGLVALGLLVGAVSGALATYAIVTSGGHAANQPYADEQGRTISSLSANDVADLSAGRGWGLAKPAEFNGYPGPAHVIEFAGELNMTAGQRAAIDASFDSMQQRAKRLGLALIDAEKALDSAFVDKSIDSGKTQYPFGFGSRYPCRLAGSASGRAPRSYTGFKRCTKSEIRGIAWLRRWSQGTLI